MISQNAAGELADKGIEVEIIDLRTILPWDKELVFKSLSKTSRAAYNGHLAKIGLKAWHLTIPIENHMAELFPSPPTYPSIKGFSVTGLHGVIDQGFGEGSSYPMNWSPLIMLYGANGCGKTSVLWFLYHLLSPNDNAGHRSALARMKFTAAKAYLTNDIVIEVLRTSDRKYGPYRLAFSVGSRTIFELDVPVTDDVSVQSEDVSEYSRLLRRYGPSISLLDDRRRFWDSDHLPHHTRDRRIDEIEWGVRRIAHVTPERGRGNAHSHTVDEHLAITLDNLQRWAAKEGRQASLEGEGNIHQTYRRILRETSQKELLTVEESESEVSTFLKELRALPDRIVEFEKLGLATRFDTEIIVKIVENTKRDKYPVVAPVLESFLNVTRARLDALNRLKNTLGNLVAYLNHFYSHRHVVFDLLSGFTVVDNRSQKDVPALLLSSGEKHLLHIMCFLTATRSSPSLLMIDEPEISLNYEWQREMPAAILDLIEDSPLQVVLATHSVELLSRKRQNIVKLRD